MTYLFLITLWVRSLGRASWPVLLLQLGLPGVSHDIAVKWQLGWAAGPRRFHSHVTHWWPLSLRAPPHHSVFYLDLLSFMAAGFPQSIKAEVPPASERLASETTWCHFCHLRPRGGKKQNTVITPDERRGKVYCKSHASWEIQLWLSLEKPSTGCWHDVSFPKLQRNLW